MIDLNNRKEKEDEQRILPTTKDYLDFKSNKHEGWLFAVMSAFAEYDSKTRLLIYPKKEYLRDVKVLQTIVPHMKDDRTLRKYRDKLIEDGYITQDDKNFYIKNYFEDTFEYLNRKLLKRLVYTRNSINVQLFIYLLSKYRWKIKEGKKYYEFTIQELKTALGFATSTRVIEELINESLASLRREGYLDYEDTFTRSKDNTHVIPVKYLTYVREVPFSADDDYDNVT